MNNNIENSLKDKFDHFQADVNPALFDQIIAERNKRRAGAIWFSRIKWSAAVLLLLSTVIFFIGKNQSSDTDSDLNNTEIANAPNNANESNSIPSDNQASNTNVESQDLETELESPIVAENNPSNANELPRDYWTEENNDVLVDRDNPETDLSDNIEMDIHLEDNTVEDVIVDNTSDEPEAEILEDVIANDEPTDNEPDLPIVANTTTSTTKDSAEINSPPDQSGISFIPSGFSLDLLWGAGYASRVLSGEAESVALRDNTESALLSQSFELGVNYNLNNNWSIRSGLRYVERREAFDFSNPVELSDTSISSRTVTIYHPVNPPQYVTVYDTSIQVYTNTNEQSATNIYKSFSIPIEIERKFYFGNKWTLMGKTGLMLNVYNTQSGLRQVSENQNVSLADLDHKKIGTLSASLGLGAAYRFNERVQIVAYPQFFYDVASNKNSNLSEKEIGLFGSFGLRIDL